MRKRDDCHPQSNRNPSQKAGLQHSGGMRRPLHLSKNTGSTDDTWATRHDRTALIKAPFPKTTNGVPRPPP